MSRSRTTSPAGHSELPLPLPLGLTAPSRPLASPKMRSIDREERFFGASPTPASRTKTKIVVKSFLGWAGVMLNANPVTLWYVDLYCGRGTYRDGSWATPMELFDKASRDKRLPAVLKMLFNDSREKSIFALRESMMAHPHFGDMRFPPQFSAGEVNEDMVAELRSRRPRTPTFAFIDPFGYKGLTQQLIREILREYGCDVMFFFSYHPIKRVLMNPNNKLRGHVEALLGRDRVAALRELFEQKVSECEMERAMLDALAESMRAIDGQTVLTFAFRRRTGHASHHLAFVSKHTRGFEVAKEAMASCSSWFHDDGIPSLEYVEPGYENTLVRVNPPTIDGLMGSLAERLGGKTVSVDEAYSSVLFGTPYIRTNVREALVRFVQNHGATLFSDGQPAKMRGSRFPHNPTVRIPRLA